MIIVPPSVVSKISPPYVTAQSVMRSVSSSL